MLDHAEIGNHAEKDSEPFVVAGAASHEELISKVWSCRFGI